MSEIPFLPVPPDGWVPLRSRQAFVFVRHGETDYNRRHVRCGGDVDVPLTPLGEHQAREAGRSLRESGHSIDAIIAGPLSRTVRTALIIAESLSGRPLFLHRGLVERRLGQWNGLPIDETQPMLEAGIPPPGGETEEEFRCRIRSTLAEISACGCRLPLLVSSKGVARVLLALSGGGSGSPFGNADFRRFDLWVGAADAASGPG